MATRAPWTKCPRCENYRCNIHHKHVHDCDCPSIDEWRTDPYSAVKPITPIVIRHVLYWLEIAQEDQRGNFSDGVQVNFNELNELIGRLKLSGLGE